MKEISDFIVEFSDFFGGLSDYQKVAIWNLYQDYCNGSDAIFNNGDEFFDMFFGGKTPFEIAEAIEGTNWSSSHTYVKINGYGNIEAFDNVDDVIYVEEIAEFAYSDMSFLSEIESIDEGASELIKFLEEDDDDL